jgi:hypothetical protein
VTYAKAYLSESALVQKSLLELCDCQQGYAASAVPPGGPEEGVVTKEPGRDTPGDGTSACVVCHSPPLDEALGIKPDDLPELGNAVTLLGPLG